MKRLWAPWRLAYVTGASGADAGGCIFCEALDAPPAAALVLHRGVRCFVILNKFPYNNGHLMVVPVRHAAALADLDQAELGELAALTRTAEMALARAYAPHGFNVGINLGRAAGAGAPGHLHVHLVPRWEGDTNFMTVVADTRVVPEEPGATAARLRPIFKELLTRQEPPPAP